MYYGLLGLYFKHLYKANQIHYLYNFPVKNGYIIPEKYTMLTRMTALIYKTQDMRQNIMDSSNMLQE